MPTYYEKIPDDLRRWALEQPLFWTASAPVKGAHVNISPKGLSSATFTIFDENHAAYLDTTGSGCETISHIYENGRVTICWCSFDSMCRIMRLYCHGSVVELEDPSFDSILASMGQSRESVPGVRAVIYLNVWKVSSSCGFSVPLLEPQMNDGAGQTASVVRHFKDRDVGAKWYDQMVKKEKLAGFMQQYNSHSLDGLPGMKSIQRQKGESVFWSHAKIKFERQLGDVRGVLLGFILGVVLMIALRSQHSALSFTTSSERAFAL